MPWRETRSGTPLRHMSAYVGGLGSGMYEDLMGFLDQSHYDVALIQETKLRADSEHTPPQWICVGSGSIAQKHAGVMILIRRTLTNATEARHDHARTAFARMLSPGCLQPHDQRSLRVSTCVGPKRCTHPGQETGFLAEVCHSVK